MDILRRCRRLLPHSVSLPLLAKVRARRGEPGLRLIACLGHRDQSFVDVGANVGLYTHVAAKHFRHVYAVEPHPACAKSLRSTFGNNVTVLEYALSERPGRMPLFIPTRQGHEIKSRCSLDMAANTDFSQNTCSVKVQRLDDLNINDVGMIKIDVEGHELPVMKGGINTIKTQRPYLLIEIEERHHPGQSKEIIQFIEELGYQPYFIMKHKLHEMAHFSFERYQTAANAKSPEGPRSSLYVNNFLFLPKLGDHLGPLRRGGFL